MPQIVDASGLALASGDATLSLDHPVIGWRNLVTTATVAAETEDASYPVTNLANPATHLKWMANDTTEQDLSVTVSGAGEIDYVAIARHNLASAGVTVTIGYETAGPTWHDLVAEATLPDDGPALFRFTATSALDTLKVRLGSGSAKAEIAVLYAGKLTVMPRRLYMGFTPPTFGRTAKVTNGRSEAGEFLGRIVTQEYVATKVPFSLIEADAYASRIDPFFASGRNLPFFFGFRPQTFPDQVGYCVLNADPMPIYEAPQGLVSFSLDMTGVV